MFNEHRSVAAAYASTTIYMSDRISTIVCSLFVNPYTSPYVGCYCKSFASYYCVFAASAFYLIFTAHNLTSR